MGENEFELDGKRYIAVGANIGCIGCAMDDLNVCPRHVKSDKVPNCAPSLRKDGRNVIFVEKQQ